MPITSSTDLREDLTSSGTGSPSVERTTTGFTRKAGRPGARDSTTSLVGVLWATLKHPFGIHDYIEEIEWERMPNGIFMEVGTERFCWLCRAKEYST